MTVAPVTVGIDASTWGYDLVSIGGDTPPEWYSVRAPGKKAADRLPHLRGLMPPPGWWTLVELAGIERPAGAANIETLGSLHLAVGIAIAGIPDRIYPWRLRPAEWRKAIGLSPIAPKLEVAEWARAHGALEHWTQDACDALAVAHATRVCHLALEKGTV